ncbi:hypothetical protein ACRAKI_13650 [Saccharothrix isguenensis]
MYLRRGKGADMGGQVLARGSTPPRAPVAGVTARAVTGPLTTGLLIPPTSWPQHDRAADPLPGVPTPSA